MTTWDLENGIARSGLFLLGALYLLGGLAAIAGFFRMRHGPPFLAAWFASAGLPATNFLVTGAIYGAIGLAGLVSARALGRGKRSAYAVAGAVVVLVVIDVVADLARLRGAAFDRLDVAAPALTGALALVTAVALTRKRRGE